MHKDKDKLVNAAVAMAKEIGLVNITRQDLCDRAGIKDGSFHYVAGCNFNDFIDEISPLTQGIKPLKSSRKNLKGSRRKEQILVVAVDLAKDHGYHKVTREQIAEQAGISKGLITNYYSMDQLRAAIMKRAIKTEVVEIVAQGIANKDKRASKISEELRKKVVESLMA